MFGIGFNVAKCETQTRLCLGRIKLQRNKRTLQAKQYRKEIAELLRSGKQESARIRVEAVIRENLLLRAYEILELYLELLTVRIQLIAKTKEIPGDMDEAISSIIYASQRISDMPELLQLRAMFAAKYGKEYAAEASSDATAKRWRVNQNLIKCLLVEPPQPEEKLQMLSDIAQEHGVEWDLSAAARDLLPPESAPGGTIPATPAPAPAQPAPAQPAPVPMAATGYSYAAPTAQGQYADAQQAAVAAAQAASQAQAAAQYAAEYVRQQQQYAAPQAGMGLPMAGPPQPLGPNWLLHQTPGVGYATGAGPSAAAHPAPTSVETSHPAAGAAPPPAAPQHGPGGFAVKSEEEIQKAYDDAVGPPTKGAINPATAPPPPPAAMPEASLEDLPRPPTQPVAPLQPTSSWDSLPHPPTGSIPPAEPVDEYDELTRRLDALKRS